MTSPAAPAGAPIGHAEIRTILIGVVLAMLLGALDQTIVVTALPGHHGTWNEAGCDRQLVKRGELDWCSFHSLSHS